MFNNRRLKNIHSGQSNQMNTKFFSRQEIGIARNRSWINAELDGGHNVLFCHQTTTSNPICVATWRPNLQYDHDECHAALLFLMLGLIVGGFEILLT